MLSITGLHNFYYLPGLHDMRCKAPRIFEIIRARYHRNPLRVEELGFSVGKPCNKVNIFAIV